LAIRALYCDLNVVGEERKQNLNGHEEIRQEAYENSIINTSRGRHFLPSKKYFSTTLDFT